MINYIKLFTHKIQYLFNKDAKKKSSGEYEFLNDIPELKKIKEINLFEVIGKRIIDIRTVYLPKKVNGWMDYAETFITLNDNNVIILPVTGSVTTNVVVTDKQATKIDTKYAINIIDQKITNIYYEYYENIPDSSQPSYLLLENGFALSSTSIGISGAGNAGLLLYNKQVFDVMIMDKELDLRPLFDIDKSSASFKNN